MVRTGGCCRCKLSHPPRSGFGGGRAGHGRTALSTRGIQAKQNPAPTQAGQVPREILQHLNIRSGQLFGVGDDGNLPRQRGWRWRLHRLRQPQLGNALVDVAEPSQALLTCEVLYRNSRGRCVPQTLQGVRCTPHGLAVLTPNDQLLIILQNGQAQRFQFRRWFSWLGRGWWVGVRRAREH